MRGSGAVPRERDLRGLAGYVRNRLAAGEVAEFRAAGATFFIVMLPLRRVLVATDKGESFVVSDTTPVSIPTLVAGRFSLARAAYLCHLFRAMSGKVRTQGRAGKHGDGNGRKQVGIEARAIRHGHAQA